MSWIRRHVAGTIVTLVVAVAVLAAAVGWFVVSVLPSIRAEVDHAGALADAALSKGTSLEVRVGGIEQLKPQVDDALAQARALNDLVQAGLGANLASLGRTVDTLVAAVRSIPALAAEAAEGAATQLAALLDTVSGIVADLRRGTTVSVPVTGSVRVDVDVHLIRPLVADLLNLLNQLLAKET